MTSISSSQSSEHDTTDQLKAVDSESNQSIRTLGPRDVDELPPKEDAWAQISTIIGKVDTDRVKDCQEDIDNILVFTGLYSAVLTALLVESYKTLQQDPQDTMVYLLQQLVLQTNSFVINDGFVNSTLSPPPLAPPFAASTNAQRVNILWFASLTLSLMSASLSIVVKQWLREFLAREESSPRAHLRIRYFRIPGLKHYKVFEIAALFPLLLQLSLLLLFVGLCFFTAHTHESIGNTTLPLIAAWAFFLVSTALVPFLDAGCPYKVPILKTLSETCRIPRLGFSLNTQNGKIKLDATRPEENALLHESNLKGGAPFQVEKARGYTISAVRNEKDIAHDESRDVDILVDALNIDVIQANDRLLKDIMLQALRQASIKPHELSKFPFAVMNVRMKRREANQHHNVFPNMADLSRQTYETITYMLALLLEEAMGNTEIVALLKSSDSHSDDKIAWLNAGIRTLLSDAQYPHSPEVNKALYACLSQNRHLHLSRIIHHTPHDSEHSTIKARLKSALGRLQGGLVYEKDTQKLVEMLEHLLQKPTIPPNCQDTAVGTQGPDADRRTAQLCPDDCKPIVKRMLSERIKSDSIRDVAVLTRIDAILVDDKLLEGAIWRALENAGVNGTKLSEFIIKATSHRISRDVSTTICEKFLDPAELPPGDVITKLAAEHVIQEVRLREGSRPYSKELQDVICILLSEWHCCDLAHHTTVDSAVKACLSNGNHVHTADLIRSRSGSYLPTTANETVIAPFLGALKRSRGGFALVENPSQLEAFIQHLFRAPTESHLQTKLGGRQQDFPSLTLTIDNNLVEYEIYIPNHYREVVLDLFSSRIMNLAENPKVEWGQGTMRLFEWIFYLSCESESRPPPANPSPSSANTDSGTFEILGPSSSTVPESISRCRSKIVDLAERLLALSSITAQHGDSDPESKELTKCAEAICDIVLNIQAPNRPRKVTKMAQKLLIETARKVLNYKSSDSRGVGMSRILTILDKYRRRTGSSDTQSSEVLIGSFYACHFFLELLSELPNSLRNHPEHWRRLFEPIVQQLGKLSSDLSGTFSNDLTAQIASECLSNISNIQKSKTTRNNVENQTQMSIISKLKSPLERIRDARQTAVVS